MRECVCVLCGSLGRELTTSPCPPLYCAWYNDVDRPAPAPKTNTEVRMPLPSRRAPSLSRWWCGGRDMQRFSQHSDLRGAVQCVVVWARVTCCAPVWPHTRRGHHAGNMAADAFSQGDVIRLSDDDMVAHVVGSSKDKNNWKAFWLKNCQEVHGNYKWPEVCQTLGCTDAATVGAHVYIRGEKGQTWVFILPTCQGCNMDSESATTAAATRGIALSRMRQLLPPLRRTAFSSKFELQFGNSLLLWRLPA